MAGLDAAGTCIGAASATRLLDSAERWQTTFDAIHSDTWSGGDGAHSVSLPDGRTLVLFGDTFGGAVTSTGARHRKFSFFSNSMAVVDGDRIEWINKPRQPAIPPAADGTVYWPEAAVAAGNTLHVFANRVRRAGTAVSGIRVVGQSMVTFDLDTFALQAITSLEDELETPTGKGVWWSAGAAIDHEYVYVYGVQLDSTGDFGRSVYVARTSSAKASERSRWRYWNGTGWTSDKRLPAAGRLISKQADTVVSVWCSGRTWNLVSQKYGMLGRDIALWTATAPQGPWRDAGVLYTIPASGHPDALYYESTAHPEVRLASGKLLLSYSRNGSRQHICTDANWYKPQYVEVSINGGSRTFASADWPNGAIGWCRRAY